MKKEFTPDHILKGKVEYLLEDFLEDLWEEVRDTVSNHDFSHDPDGEARDKNYENDLKDVFRFVYNVCYNSAINFSRIEEVLEKADQEEKEIIKRTVQSNRGNINLLHAIFMKEISENLNKGLSKQQALKIVITHSNNAIREVMRRKSEHR